MKQRMSTHEINEIKEPSLRNLLEKITKQKVLEVKHNRNKNFTGQTQYMTKKENLLDCNLDQQKISNIKDRDKKIKKKEPQGPVGKYQNI